MTGLGYDFTTYSPRSRGWYSFAEADEEAFLLLEVERTSQALAAAAKAKVEKGQLTTDECNRVGLLWRAVGQDLREGEKWVDEYRSGAQGCRTVSERIAALNTGFTWADKVKAMRAEIERRRRDYPGDVDKGRLAPADARSQLERLEAVHFLYWHQGFAFDGTRDELHAHVNAHADALEQKEKAA